MNSSCMLGEERNKKFFITFKSLLHILSHFFFFDTLIFVISTLIYLVVLKKLFEKLYAAHYIRDVNYLVKKLPLSSESVESLTYLIEWNP